MKISHLTCRYVRRTPSYRRRCGVWHRKCPETSVNLVFLHLVFPTFVSRVCCVLHCAFLYIVFSNLWVVVFRFFSLYTCIIVHVCGVFWNFICLLFYCLHDCILCSVCCMCTTAVSLKIHRLGTLQNFTLHSQTCRLRVWRYYRTHGCPADVRMRMLYPYKYTHQVFPWDISGIEARR